MSPSSLEPLSPMNIVGWCLGLGVLLTGVMYLALAPAQGCSDRSAQECYFSVDGNIEREVLDDVLRDWYARYLNAMGEPPLGDISAGNASRFLWLRSFHDPISVRVYESKNGLQLIAVELDGAGGYAPGKELRRIERVLGKEEARTFREALKRTNVWSVPAKIDVNGIDGARWMFEFRDGDSYRIVDRWSPADDPMFELGIVFLQLTGWIDPELDIY